mmetsp:Transcript_17269/g.42896  ORF Transcript_17269/g.42896 Transcript_17269/m.42896 type:complete len:262 (-) Transcript_17269:1736-2521(-)
MSPEKSLEDHDPFQERNTTGRTTEAVPVSVMKESIRKYYLIWQPLRDPSGELREGVCRLVWRESILGGYRGALRALRGHGHAGRRPTARCRALKVLQLLVVFPSCERLRPPTDHSHHFWRDVWRDRLDVRFGVQHFPDLHLRERPRGVDHVHLRRFQCFSYCRHEPPPGGGTSRHRGVPNPASPRPAHGARPQLGPRGRIRRSGLGREFSTAAARGAANRLGRQRPSTAGEQSRKVVRVVVLLAFSLMCCWSLGVVSAAWA